MNGKEYYQQHKDLWANYTANKKRKYPLYAVWHGILVRTGIRPGAKKWDYDAYINRGISVCKSWRRYEAFEKWAFSHGYQKGLLIDRIDNDKGYSPSNCRFVTHSESQSNRRICNVCVYKGERMMLTEAYRLSGCKLSYKLVELRYSRGWDVERCLTEPVNNNAIKRRGINKGSK